MTQPPENTGGSRPAGDWSPDDQDADPPASVPPPSSWHFPPEPAYPPAEAEAKPQQGYGAQAPPGGTQPHGTQPLPEASPYGTQPEPGTPPYGTQPPQSGTSPYGTQAQQSPQPYDPQQPYGGQQPNGAPPPPYGTPAPPHGAPPNYGAPPPYGAPPHYGTPPNYGAPQHYGAPQQYGPPPYASPPPYGTSPHYGTPQYGAPAPYGTPYGAAYPSYGAGFPAGPEPDLAEWWRRLLGRLIDVLVLGAVTTPIAFAVLAHALTVYQQTLNRYPDVTAPGAQAAINHADGKLFGAYLLFAVIAAVLSFVYDTVQHGLWGRTLGKRALGTRVVSARDRSKISGGTAAGRAAMYALIPVIPLAGTIFWLLNALWLLWDRRRQCLHDKGAHTIVVKTRYPAAGPQPPASPW